MPIIPASMMPVHSVSKRSTSPPIPSPSQLMWFLKYAETELHVENATVFERKLVEQHIGPDILPKIDNRILAVEIGIPASDIIHLKKGSIAWWNGPDVKHKHSNTDQSQFRSPTHPPQKRVTYKKKCHDGGCCCFTRSLMIARDDDRLKDYNLWYQSTDHGTWLPVPREFIVCEDGDDDA
ncbi:hypothetical protein J3R82DRAFT_5277, partial [Butyriboletus roseoflavus]